LSAASAKGREQWEQPLHRLSHGVTPEEPGFCSKPRQINTDLGSARGAKAGAFAAFATSFSAQFYE